MPYEPDNHSPSKSRELAFLVNALGIDELYERVNDLDGKGGLPVAGDFNPTGDPQVQPDNTYQVGSLSGGPTSENVGDLSVIDPDHVARIERLAAEAEARKEAEAEGEGAPVEEEPAEEDDIYKV